MNSKTLTWTKPERQTSRSKVMFTGDFKKELEKNISFLEAAIEQEILPNFTSATVITGNNELKIRIDDREKGIKKRIRCVLWYHHDEQKFGNIHVELTISELGEETKVHPVGTFKITDYKAIQEATLSDIALLIKEQE